MNMVRRPSRRQQGDVLGAGYPGEVPAHLPDVGNQIEAAFGAEDAMHQDPCVRVRHSQKLPGISPQSR